MPLTGDQSRRIEASKGPLSAEDQELLRPQDEISLAAFIGARDRANPFAAGPPFFSGRRSELEAFRGMLDAAEEGMLANSS